MDEWWQIGYDRHSIIADPLFKDLKNHDFTLTDNLLALGLGFRPIDVSDVGPRPKGQRIEEMKPSMPLFNGNA